MFMSLLTAIVFFVSLFVFAWGIIGMIKPRLILQKTRGGVAKVMLISVVSAFLALVFKPTNNQKNQTQTVNAAETTVISNSANTATPETEAQTKASQEAEERVKQAEAKAKEAEERAKQAQAKAQEAEERAKQAQAKIKEAEAKEAEAKIKAAEEQAKQSEVKAKETEAKPFEMSHDQFLKRIQDRESAALVGFDINEKSETKQEDGTITRVVMLNKFGFITTDSNPDDKLTNVLYISSGDGTQASGMEIIYMTVSVLDAIEKKFSNQQANEFLFNELNPTKLVEDGKGKDVSKYGVNYSLSRSSAIGLMLNIKRE